MFRHACGFQLANQGTETRTLPIAAAPAAEPLRRFRRRELLTRDEAQRIAAIFAKLPELLGKRSNDSASEEGGAK